MSRCGYRSGIRTALAVWICAGLFIAVEVHANTFSGASCTGTPGACYSDELKTLIEECIQGNVDNPPVGNPGPFTQGYNSIVVLSGQCFSGGLSELTGIGDDIVVGAAAASDKESHWQQTGSSTSSARYLWLDKLIKEINSNPNRKIKDVLDAVKTANPDANAGTPAPSVSTGGANVTLGNPSNTGTKSYHAVLFGGVQDDPATDTNAAGQNAAAQKALDDMETALKDKLHVPAANIAKKFPGTCQELKDLIKAAWTKMNDNEQFILVLSNHGASCTMEKTPVQDDPDTGGQKSSFVTPNHFGSDNVTDPSILLDTDQIFEPAPVMLNGQPIGNLSPSTAPVRQEIPFPKAILNPPGQPNLLQILAPSFSAPIFRVGLATGPVAASIPPVPAIDIGSFVLLALGIVVVGILVVRARARAAA